MLYGCYRDIQFSKECSKNLNPDDITNNDNIFKQSIVTIIGTGIGSIAGAMLGFIAPVIYPFGLLQHTALLNLKKRSERTGRELGKLNPLSKK